MYDRFDIDKSGRVCADELRALGQARRKLGHKRGEWTEAQNERLMRRLDTDRDGTVSCFEFCMGFAEMLPGDIEEFRATMRQFHDVATQVVAEKNHKAITQPVSVVGQNEKIRALQQQLQEMAKSEARQELAMKKLEDEKFALAKELKAKESTSDSAGALRMLNKELQATNA